MGMQEAAMLIVLKAQQKQLDELIAETKLTNQLLARIATALESQTIPAQPGGTSRQW